MLSDENYKILKEASTAFLDEKEFGIEEAMKHVFGSDRDNEDAKACRTSNLDHLKIESLVNRSNSKLLAWYDPSAAPKEVKSSIPGSTLGKKWTSKDANWSPKDLW